MAHEVAPAFQFYPKDLLTDENWLAMTFAAKGAYWQLLSTCWLQGSLPSDTKKLARMLVLSDRKFKSLWEQIAPCFQEVGDRLVHPRLEKEREKQAKRRAQSKGAADKRWHGSGDAPTMLPHNSGNTPVMRPVCTAPSSTTTTATAVQARTPKPPKHAESFDRFWAVYPKRKSKAAAHRTWTKLAPSAELVDKIISAVTVQATTEQWTNEAGKYIPEAARWLRDQRWEDIEPDVQRSRVGKYGANLLRSFGTTEAEFFETAIEAEKVGESE